MATTRSSNPHPGPAWIAAGVRALDTSTGRIGIVQLLRDSLGEVRTDVIDHQPLGYGRARWLNWGLDCFVRY